MNDVHAHSHHVELTLHADDAAIIAKSLNPTLLVSYLESYFNDFQRGLAERINANNVPKSNAITFVRTGRHFMQAQLVTRR